VVFDGVKVAVTTELPAFPKSKSDPEIDTTDVVADEYVHVPVAAVVATVGAVIARFASPKVAVTPAQLNVGVACPTVTVMATVPLET
jgi:hypothetical protein